MGWTRITVFELTELDPSPQLNSSDGPIGSKGYFETERLAFLSAPRLVGHGRFFIRRRHALLVDTLDRPRLDSGEVFLLSEDRYRVFNDERKPVRVRRVKRCKAVIGEDWNTKEKIRCDKKVQPGAGWCRKHTKEFGA